MRKQVATAGAQASKDSGNLMATKKTSAAVKALRQESAGEPAGGHDGSPAGGHDLQLGGCAAGSGHGPLCSPRSRRRCRRGHRRPQCGYSYPLPQHRSALRPRTHRLAARPDLAMSTTCCQDSPMGQRTASLKRSLHRCPLAPRGVGPHHQGCLLRRWMSSQRF